MGILKEKKPEKTPLLFQKSTFFNTDSNPEKNPLLFFRKTAPRENPATFFSKNAKKNPEKTPLLFFTPRKHRYFFSKKPIQKTPIWGGGTPPFLGQKWGFWGQKWPK